MFVMYKAVGAFIKKVNTAVGGSHPHIPLRIAVQREDGIIAETGLVDIVVGASPEIAQIVIQDTDAAVLRSDPDVSPFVIRQCKHHIQRGRMWRVGAEMPEVTMHRIIKVQTAIPHTDPK